MANQIIVSEDRNQITVVEGETRIVEVVTQGPQGPIGPSGPAGPSGSSILNQITSGSVTASVDIGTTIFSLTSGSSTYLNVSSLGNVGIGNTNPTSKLDVIGTTRLSGSASITGSLTVTGAITAQTLVVQTITSSVSFITGSTKFGSLSTNTHEFTGSIFVSGSATITSGLSAGNISAGSLAAGATSIVGLLQTPAGIFCDNNLARFRHVTVGVNQASGTGFIQPEDTSQSIGIRTGASFGGTQRLLVTNTGLVAIGSHTPIATLDVSGSTRLIGNTIITGSGNTSATNALTVLNSAGSNLLLVRNDGLTTISGNATFLGTIAGSNASRFVIAAQNFAINITSNNPTNGEGSLITTGAITTTDNQTKNVIEVNNAVTSTAASFNTLNGFAFTSTINQTLGTIRGLYINPTLTSATNFRAIEWSNNAFGSTSWGLYGAGTAPNFLSGSLNIGTTVTGSSILNVNGNVSIKGTDNSGTIGLNVVNSNNVSTLSVSNAGDVTVGTSLITNNLIAKQNQNILIAAYWANSSNVTIQTFSNSPNGLIVNHSAAVTRTFGGNIVFQATETFSPASGDATSILALLNPTISQSSATGVTRGLYVNPTLTSAADWRSIEWSNNTGWGLYGAGSAPSYLSGSLNIGTTTLGSNILNVSGSTLLRGGGNTSGTSALVVQNSDSTNTLIVRNDGQIFMQANRTFNSDTITAASANLSLQAFNSATHVRIIGGTNATPAGVVIGNANNITLTSGVRHSLAFDDNFTPTSGTSERNYIYMGYTINQSGGASGITRGIYIQPTLTSAWDFRAIEWSNNLSAVSGSWGLYGAGTAPSYMAGTLNVGINTIISREAGWSTVQIGQSIFTSRTSDGYTLFGRNIYKGTAGDNIYITTSTSAVFDIETRNFSFYSAPSGTAGTTATFTKHLQLFGTTGNLVLQNGGTFTDSGERLQVSGSSRFLGNVLISGSGNTSGTNALNIQNSDAVSIMSFRNDGNIYADGTNFTITRYTIGATTLTISNAGHNGATGISTTSAIGLVAVSSLGVSTNNPRGASIYAAGGNTNAPTNISLGLLSNRALITSVASGTAMHTSSMLQVDSTSQGFLPPRMTTTQKNAIATPAAGLVVYDTTLNKLCVYTTTWETITSA